MPLNRETRYGLEMVDLSDATSVAAAGGTDTQQLKPPVGFVYEVVNLHISIPPPAGAGANTHTLAATVTGFSDVEISLETAFNKTMTIAQYTWTADTKIPSSGVTQAAAQQRLVASNSVPLDFVYTNDTDTNQTGTRTINVLVKKRREA